MKNISRGIQWKSIIRLKLVNSRTAEDNRTVLVPTLLPLGSVKVLYFNLTTATLNSIKTNGLDVHRFAPCGLLAVPTYKRKAEEYRRMQCMCTDLLLRAQQLCQPTRRMQRRGELVEGICNRMQKLGHQLKHYVGRYRPNVATICWWPMSNHSVVPVQGPYKHNRYLAKVRNSASQVT